MSELASRLDGPVIHPTAIVEEGALIGPGTRVWHHCHVRAGSVIGADCNIGKNVYVDSGAAVGSRVKIQNNVSVYHGVTLEDDVFVGPSAVFTNDMYPRANNPTWDVVPTMVRRGASVCANATIVCGTEVGSYAVVAAGAVVTRNVQPHQLVRGNPARPGGWVCVCGRVVSRQTDPPEDLQCDTCRPNSSPVSERDA